MTRESHERFYILRHWSRLMPECTGISVMRKDFNKNSFTRAEAVKIMSEAMFSKNNATPLYIYDELAEKALNALLGGKNG